MITREQLLKNERFWTETIQNKIYNDLASFVKKENISQKEIAKKMGVSKGRISQILKGDNLNFRIDTLVKICLSIGKVPSFNLEDIDSFIEDDVRLSISPVSTNKNTLNLPLTNQDEFSEALLKKE